MTLYRQLLATMLALFAILFVAAYLVQFNSTRSYLAQQLSLSVTSTANSVGLALTPYLETADKVGAESVINAAFDGGFYQRFKLKMLADNSEIVKENSSAIEGVPSWFINLRLFEPVKFQAVLTSGWLQLGQLDVEGNPGQAYYELWRGMRELLISFFTAFLITTLLLMQALRYLLKPLEQICAQAVEIEQHHFGHTIPLPKTAELKQVVVSINTLTAKLAHQFKEQAEATERLRERVYRDAVSGLGNRAHFVGQVNAWTAESGHGGVMLVSVDVLDDIYRNEGFGARDNMVKSVATSLSDLLRPYDGHALARISAIEYAILLPGVENTELHDIGQQMNRAIAELVVNPIEQDHPISVVGIAERAANDDLTSLLTKADSAVRRARSERQGSVVMASDEKSDCLGRMAWRNLLELALQQNLFRFKSQPAIMLVSGQHYHAELFTSIHKDGEDYFAGQFMSALEQFKLGAEFDKHVLLAVSERLSTHRELRLAINLTLTSISSSKFVAWLDDYLANHANLAHQLVFELPESAIVHSRQQVEQLVAVLRQHSFMWGVDQYGRNFQSLDYLETLRPSYVKVDYCYTSMVLKDEGDQAFLSAVCRTAHHAGVVTIATRVENQEQVHALSKLFVDGYQGFVSPPTPLL